MPPPPLHLLPLSLDTNLFQPFTHTSSHCTYLSGYCPLSFLTQPQFLEACPHSPLFCFLQLTALYLLYLPKAVLIKDTHLPCCQSQGTLAVIFLDFLVVCDANGHLLHDETPSPFGPAIPSSPPAPHCLLWRFLFFFFSSLKMMSSLQPWFLGSLDGSWLPHSYPCMLQLPPVHYLANTSL